MASALVQAHATVMILSWLFFGSTGILFARYCRSLRFGTRRQLLGKAVWFQIHRFLLSFTALLALLGFFFILVYKGEKWADPQVSLLRFLHSVFGGIIVCCVILQIWLALYRCNPHSRYRYIFDWSHRIIGLLAFGLSPLTILFIVVALRTSRTVLIIIVALWIGWIILVIFIFEQIESRQRTAVAPATTNKREDDPNPPGDIESATNTNVGNRHLNLIKLILLFLHIVISVILSISFIVIFCS